MKGIASTRLLLGLVAMAAVLLGTLPARGRDESKPAQVALHQSEAGSSAAAAGSQAAQADMSGLTRPVPSEGWGRIEAATGSPENAASTGRQVYGAEGAAGGLPGEREHSEPRDVSSESGPPPLAIDVPELPPDYVREVPDDPNIVWIGNCVVTADALEIFPAGAVARGQRVFDSPERRVYIRADGTCVSILKGAGIPLPDYVPEGPLPAAEDVTQEDVTGGSGAAE